MAYLVNGIWLHQFDKCVESNVRAFQALWPRTIYVKALDGVYPMTQFDTSALSVRGDAGGGLGSATWTWRETGWTPWVVPRGFAVPQEAALAGALASESLVLDLEPYKGFWAGDDRDLANWIFGLGGRPFDLCLDYRRLAGFPSNWIMKEAGRLLAQCYWTEFGTDWEHVLEDAMSAIGDYPGSPELVLSGDAVPSDLELAIRWCQDHRVRCSVWVWQHLTPAQWAVIHAAQDVTIEAKGE